MLDIITAYATKNECYIKNQKMTPVGIVLHSTGVNNPNLKRYVDCPTECGVNNYNNHWNNPSSKIGKVCVHSFIGYDKNKQVRVANILPYTTSCWGCGKGKKGSYNYDPVGHIQIELCEDDLKSREYYTLIFKTAAEYCAMLCKQFNFSPVQIVSHHEAYIQGYASNHADCDHWMRKYGHTMDDFRNMVTEILQNENKLPYIVRITAKVLNVRQGAGTNYKIVRTVQKNEAFTIVEEKKVGNATWGKLKSGIGWICLTNYTEQID